MGFDLAKLGIWLKGIFPPKHPGAWHWYKGLLFLNRQREEKPWATPIKEKEPPIPKVIFFGEIVEILLRIERRIDQIYIACPKSKPEGP